MSGGVIAAEGIEAGAERAGRVVARLGGRFSVEEGIDVDAGDAEVERWFLAATLFGARISTAIAERTFGELDRAGVLRVTDARAVPWDDLVAILDEGGYARYDFRTATRLHDLSDIVTASYGGEVAEIGRRFSTYPEVRDALDALPGWGPTTVELFLRELRGVWAGATPPLDKRAATAAAHLHIVGPSGGTDPLAVLIQVAGAAGIDIRDLESGLVRLALAHRRGSGRCPGGDSCVVLARRQPETRGRH